MTIVDRRYSVAEGTAVKAPCRAATTANITLSGLQTIDGIAVVADYRVLVKNQSTGSQNGIYTASSGNWTRARDFDGAYDIVTGTRIFVTSGSANGGAEFVVSTADPITIDTTSIAFTSIIATAIASAAAAAASASAASTSAGAASTSATAAASSVTAASSSATAAATSAAAAVAAISQTPYEVDLRDLMNTYYGVGLWTKRTGIATGSDIGPAITAGITAIRSTFGRCIIKVPPGLWLYTTPVSGALLSGSYFIGAGSQASIIVCNFDSGVAFNYTGAAGFTGGGVKHIGIVLESGKGLTLAIPILLQGDATYQPDQTEWRDLYITVLNPADYWYNGFQIDGSARSVPPGCRVGMIENVQIFHCRNIGFHGANMVQWTVLNLGTYQGSGLFGSDIFFEGTSTQVHGLSVVGSTIHTSTGINIWMNGTQLAP